MRWCALALGECVAGALCTMHVYALRGNCESSNFNSNTTHSFLICIVSIVLLYRYCGSANSFFSIVKHVVPTCIFFCTVLRCSATNWHTNEWKHTNTFIEFVPRCGQKKKTFMNSSASSMRVKTWSWCKPLFSYYWRLHRKQRNQETKKIVNFYSSHTTRRRAKCKLKM